MLQILEEWPLPIDEVLDVSLESDTTNLDKLDRQSKKAVKSLEKQRKALEKAQKQQEIGGGIFQGGKLPTGGGGPKDIARLSKQDEKIQKKLRKIDEDIRKDQVKQLGKKSSFLEGILGKKAASNIFAMGKNPKGFFFGIAKALPFLGGVFAAKEIADFIIDELIKLDKFLKAFIDNAEDRENRTRTLEQQARLQAGLDQQIITTASGTVDPREAYNTFERFNQNQGEIETKYQLQNNSGVE